MKLSAHRPATLVAAAVLLLSSFGTAFFLATPSARGDAAADQAAAEKAAAEKAEAAAVARGKTLWRQAWRSGAKGCFACHTRGPNQMAARRLRAYPKYDKTMGRVVSVRQKINDMIRTKSGGQPLDLDSDDLTALEAYMATLK